jgi:PAS domain S-box-containing protein
MGRDLGKRMKRRSRGGGRPAKARRRKVPPKQRNALKTTRRHSSSTTVQMELRTSEERWRSLLNNPIFGVTFLDDHQRFITTSRTFQNMVGYSDAELRQITPLDISVPDEREINEAFFSEMRQGKRQHYEMIKQLQCKDGKLIWVHLYVFAVTDRKSGTQFPFGIVFDITEKKQAQDALQKTRTELARVARMNQMVAMTGSIVHEINQPIAAIVANASAGLRWLERTNPDVNETRAVLRAILREGQRTDNIIQGIRATFKADVEARVSIDLNKLLREVLVVVQGDHQDRPIEVHTDLDESLPLVAADRVQLQQVIFNLITNAVDAMNTVTDRARSLRVVSGLNGGKSVVVTIEDTGTGFAPGNIDRVFDTFFTTKANGMGMGLAICRSIVESHGGRLTVSPGYPHGAVFKVVLPIGRSSSDDR